MENEKKGISEDPMIGLYFHTWKKDPTMPNGVAVEYQGQIMKAVAPGLYLVDHFGWSWGQHYQSKLVKLESMMDWSLYTSQELMKEAGTEILERQSRIRQQKNETTNTSDLTFSTLKMRGPSKSA